MRGLGSVIGCGFGREGGTTVCSRALVVRNHARVWTRTRARRLLLGCAVLLGSMLLSGCRQLGERGEDERARAAEVTVRSLMAAFETADSALVRDLFWPQATYDDFPDQHTYRGVEEIVGYVTGVHRWADDVLFNVGEVHVTTDGAVVEWLFSAVQARPMGGLSVGTGNEVVLNGVTVIELDGERIIRAADYTDSGAMWLQLGGRVELPDGTTLELGDLGN